MTLSGYSNIADVENLALNYVFSILTWALLAVAAFSLFTTTRIAIRVFRRTVGAVDNAIFSGTKEPSIATSRRPALSFTLIFLFDLSSLNAVLGVMLSEDISAYLSWSVLLLVLLCYTIKGLYFIRVFHRLGVLDDDDLKGLGIADRNQTAG